MKCTILSNAFRREPGPPQGLAGGIVIAEAQGQPWCQSHEPRALSARSSQLSLRLVFKGIPATQCSIGWLLRKRPDRCWWEHHQGLEEGREGSEEGSGNKKIKLMLTGFDSIR